MDVSDALEHFPSFKEKLEKEGQPPVVVDTFAYYYRKVVTGETGLIYNKDIAPVGPDDIADAETLQDFVSAGQKAYRHAVRITLNGGLGSSMGLTGPKSLLEVKNDQSFLEIILRQAQHQQVRLALMNSFSTHEETLEALKRLEPAHYPLIFLQHKFPKILQADLSPARWPRDPSLEWNPPGHGDVYTALYTSGMLQKLLEEQIEYAFISNSDNLGASMDPALLGYFAENGFPFMMEVAEKTPADVKGGHLARRRDGQLILREAAQCPEEELDAFRDIQHFRYFNTNNIWIRLKYLMDLIEKKETVRLPMILNPKSLDPRDENSPGIYQVETAMGAAISLFEGAAAVRVPRSRFFPVKKCTDLLAVRSDCFVFSESENLIINPQRTQHNFPDTIKITLDSKYYGKIDEFDTRFRQIPSLMDCEALTVQGDVVFDANITIKGQVRIINRRPRPVILEKDQTLTEDLIF